MTRGTHLSRGGKSGPHDTTPGFWKKSPVWINYPLCGLCVCDKSRGGGRGRRWSVTWVDTGYSWQCGGGGGRGWACLVLSCLCPCRFAGGIHVERYIQENLFVGKVASEVVCEVVGNVSDVCEGDGDVVGVVTPLRGVAQVVLHGVQVVEVGVRLRVHQDRGVEEDGEGQVEVEREEVEVKERRSCVKMG